MGVWFEIKESTQRVLDASNVAPFVGVWIEILQQLRTIEIIMVAPFVGVWIEICIVRKFFCYFFKRRSLRGSVD